MKIYIGGTFDCLHSGHIKLFKRAKNLVSNAHVVVSVNTDEFAESYKRKPLVPLAERLAVLKELRCVDEVIVNEGGADSKPALLKTRPQFILHGSDWQGESLMKQMGVTQEWLDLQEIKLIILPYTEGISSTKIHENIRTNS